MKKLRFPLWLVCDSRAFVRLWLSLAVFGLVQRLFLSGKDAGNLSLEAAVRLIASMAACESLLRWAILRHAFRLVGLDAAAVRFVQLEGALTPTAWYCRRRRLLATLRALHAEARKQAACIRRALAAGKPGRPVAPLAPLVSSSTLFFFSVTPESWTCIRDPPGSGSSPKSQAYRTRRPHLRARSHVRCLLPSPSRAPAGTTPRLRHCLHDSHSGGFIR